MDRHVRTPGRVLLISSLAFSALTIGGFLTLTSKPHSQKTTETAAVSRDALWWAEDQITWSIGSIPSQMDRGEGASVAPTQVTQSDVASAPSIFKAPLSERVAPVAKRVEVPKVTPKLIEPSKKVSSARVPRPISGGLSVQVAKPASTVSSTFVSAADYTEVRERFAEVVPPALSDVSIEGPRKLSLAPATIWIAPMSTQPTVVGIAGVPQISSEVQAKVDTLALATHLESSSDPTTEPVASATEGFTAEELAQIDAELDHFNGVPMDTQILALSPVEILYPRMNVDFEGNVLESVVAGTATLSAPPVPTLENTLQLSIAPSIVEPVVQAATFEQVDAIRSSEASSRAPAEATPVLESEPAFDAPNYENPPMDVSVAPVIDDSTETPISTSLASISRVELPEPAPTPAVLLSSQALTKATQAVVAAPAVTAPPASVVSTQIVQNQTTQGAGQAEQEQKKEQDDNKGLSQDMSCGIKYTDGLTGEPVVSTQSQRRTYDELGPQTGWVEVSAREYSKALIWQAGCQAQAELLGQNAVRGFELLASIKQTADRGLIWVELPATYTARLSTEASTPLLLDSERKQINPADVGSERRALFFNVLPGAHLIQFVSALEGVSFSTLVVVEAGKLTSLTSLKVLTEARGVKVNDATDVSPTGLGIAGARVSKLGTDAVVDTDDQGLAWLPDPAALKGYPVVFESLQSGGFKFRSRTQLIEKTPLFLFEVPSEVIESWLAQLSDGEKPGVKQESGMAVGSVTAIAKRTDHKEFKVSYRRMDGKLQGLKVPETYALDAQFALDPDKVISAKHPRFASVELASGTWILEVRALKTGELLHSQIVPISPAVVNMLSIE